MTSSDTSLAVPAGPPVSPPPRERKPERTSAPEQEAFDVGGVRLARPFKIRRFGHFGYNCHNMEAMLEFYVDGLGLIVSDESPKMPARLPTEQQAQLSPAERLLHFTRFGSEHHQVVFISQRVWDVVNAGSGAAGASINQVTWQVGSLAEVVDGSGWIWGQGERIMRSGRDMPGSNWHTYLFDPQGHINELYYGMEQIGWDGRSKPSQMWSGVFTEKPALPQPSEATEIAQAQEDGVHLDGGYRPEPSPTSGFTADGVIMSRPFKITGIGPVSLFVDDLAAAQQFYSQVLGLEIRTRVSDGADSGVLLSCGTDHHSLALYTGTLRTRLGLDPTRDSMALAFRLANYRQLRAAVAWMMARGAREVVVPAALVPGFDYVAHLQDPDGNLVQLYYYQRQCAAPGSAPPPVSGRAGDWPELIDAPTDVFGGQVFLGPWE